ncbi:MAG: DUF3604 domain-containing protein [Myxococcota bacterium]
MTPTISKARERALLLTVFAAIAWLPSHAGALPTERPRCARYQPLRAPYFGDLHVHTQFSLDASTQGTRNRPADAYRFARGQSLGIQPYDPDGRPLRTVRLARPLDFTAVTDHAELIGEWNICNTPGLPGHGALVCRIYRRWPRAAFFWMNFTAARGERAGFCGDGGAVCLDASRAPWRETREAAAAANDRSTDCSFTTFVGYEWTGAAGVGNNFHRNVIFRNEHVPDLPASFIDAPRLDQLWARLRRDCTDAGIGCDAVVIPHNSNLSGGMMFQTVRADGRAITAEDARERARFETLAEITQHKGESECMLGMDTEDELCNFEKLAMAAFHHRYVPLLAEPPTPRQFLRNALKEGLAQEQRLGVNPFHYGFIGSTDTHLGTPGLVAESASYPGHGGAGAPVGDTLPAGLPDDIDFNPGGLAVLWAEENSREALFGAMKRREAYGTSGPRMIVRFFGGWDYSADLCDDPAFAARGYARGVPMGGDLPRASGQRAPVFAVSALRDSGAPGEPAASLERVQIVKGWLEGADLRERVYDVAGGRDPRAAVDPRDCEPGAGGHAALCAVWRDPDFEPGERAFYYVRVIENPSCRWSQRVCNARGVRCDDPATIGAGLEACCSPEHRPILQERAWTSPIWYRPPASHASADQDQG